MDKDAYHVLRKPSLYCCSKFKKQHLRDSCLKVEKFGSAVVVDDIPFDKMNHKLGVDSLNVTVNNITFSAVQSLDIHLGCCVLSCARVVALSYYSPHHLLDET